MKRAKKSTSSQLAPHIRQILERTAKARAEIDAIIHELPASERTSTRSSTFVVVPRSGISRSDAYDVAISAELEALLLRRAGARGTTIDVIADELIIEALDREHASPTPTVRVTWYRSAGAGTSILKSTAPTCDGTHERCPQPFFWRDTVRCGCQRASGRNVG